MRKKQIKVKSKVRKVWLIKPFTKVKKSGKIDSVRDKKKEILEELRMM